VEEIYMAAHEAVNIFRHGQWLSKQLCDTQAAALRATSPRLKRYYIYEAARQIELLLHLYEINR
jgi:hypothetical protein